MKSAFGTFHGPLFRIHHKNVVAPYRPSRVTVSESKT